jgi:hypothetical protein
MSAAQCKAGGQSLEDDGHCDTSFSKPHLPQPAAEDSGKAHERARKAAQGSHHCHRTKADHHRKRDPQNR